MWQRQISYCKHCKHNRVRQVSFNGRHIAILFDFKYFEPCATVDNCSDHIQRVCGASTVWSWTSVQTPTSKGGAEPQLQVWVQFSIQLVASSFKWVQMGSGVARCNGQAVVTIAELAHHDSGKMKHWHRCGHVRQPLPESVGVLFVSCRRSLYCSTTKGKICDPAMIQPRFELLLPKQDIKGVHVWLCASISDFWVMQACHKCSVWIVNTMCRADERRWAIRGQVFVFLTMRTVFECKFCSTCHLHNIWEMMDALHSLWWSENCGVDLVMCWTGLET